MRPPRKQKGTTTPPTSLRVTDRTTTPISPFVVDLRTRHRASRNIFSRSWISRILAVVVGSVPESKKARRPLPLATFRFPAWRPEALTAQPPMRAASFVRDLVRLFAADASARSTRVAGLSIGTLAILLGALTSAIIRLARSPKTHVVREQQMIVSSFSFAQSFAMVPVFVPRLRYGLRTAIAGTIARTPTARTLSAFVVSALIVVLPLHVLSVSGALPSTAAAVEQGYAAADHLADAFDALAAGDWDRAEASWKALDESSAALGKDTALTNPIIGAIGKRLSHRVQAGRAFLFGATALAKIGTAVTTLGSALAIAPANSDRLGMVPALFHDAAQSLHVFAKEAALVSVDALPEPMRPSFIRARVLLPQVEAATHRLAMLADVLPSLFGSERPMRYLVLFQNDTEIRPSGGFIGSIAILDVANGAITGLSVPEGGSYDLRGSSTAHVRPPVPLQYVNDRWEFQDTNWWADFPTTAQKILWFWAKAGQPTVDGVIAINAGLFERILTDLPPIPMPAYGKVITADNFYLETQRAVEFEYDRVANTPKKFIRDLADAVLKTIGTLGADDQRKVLAHLVDAAPRKDLMVYLLDSALEAHVVAAGLDGALPPVRSGDDELLVVHTNIGGGKTDRVVSDDLIHDTTIDADGRIVDAVHLQRTHFGKKGDPFTGVRNRDYIRFVIPKGSTLLAAEGFEVPTRAREIPDDQAMLDPLLASLENAAFRPDGTQIYDELGRTVIGGWVELDPGEVASIRLAYMLPFRFDVAQSPAYRLHLLRQPGVRGTTVEHRLHVPATLRVVDQAPMLPNGPLPLAHDRTFLTILAPQE